MCLVKFMVIHDIVRFHVLKLNVWLGLHLLRLARIGLNLKVRSAILLLVILLLLVRIRHYLFLLYKVGHYFFDLKHIVSDEDGDQEDEIVGDDIFGVSRSVDLVEVHSVEEMLDLESA